VLTWLSKRYKARRNYEIWCEEKKGYISVEEFKKSLLPSKTKKERINLNRANFAPKNYEFDQATEMILDGSQLSNKDIVLIEDRSIREEVDDLDWAPEYIVDRALITNRWCMVSDFTIVSHHLAEPTATFIGLYDDDFTVRRQYPLSYKWIVKKKDAPKKTSENDRREKITELIWKAMTVTSELDKPFTLADVKTMAWVTENTADQIVKLFE
jgi:hypothetical protein